MVMGKAIAYWPRPWSLARPRPLVKPTAFGQDHGHWSRPQPLTTPTTVDLTKSPWSEARDSEKYKRVPMDAMDMTNGNGRGQ